MVQIQYKKHDLRYCLDPENTPGKSRQYTTICKKRKWRIIFLRKVKKEMSRFIYREDIPRDIQNVVDFYVQGSRPIYRKWAEVIYTDYIRPLIGELADYINQDKMIDRIVDIFVKFFGENIGNFIEKSKQNQSNLYRSRYDIVNKILDIFIYPDISKINF